jgi:hypothetical protein
MHTLAIYVISFCLVGVGCRATITTSNSMSKMLSKTSSYRVFGDLAQSRRDNWGKTNLDSFSVVKYDSDLFLSRGLGKQNNGFESPPDICILQYPIEVAPKLIDEKGIIFLEELLVSNPSIHTVIGAVVDDQVSEGTISATFASLPGRTLFPFHTDGISEKSFPEIVGSLFPTYETPNRSILLFPHHSLTGQQLVNFIQSVDGIYPNTFKIGSFLTTHPADSASFRMPRGFLIERGHPFSKITLVKSGILGLAVTSDLRPLQTLWPEYQRSLVPLLKWGNIMGH